MKKDVLIYFDLITSIQTVQEVDELSLELDVLISTLFKSEKMTLEKALSSIRTKSKDMIMEIFSKNNLDLANKDTVRDFLDTLKDLIKKFKVIKLILAFEPTPKTIENIHEFVSENIGVGFVLDIEKDESVLAGSVVIFNGKYNDFTLRKSLEETFKGKREEITKLLNY